MPDRNAEIARNKVEVLQHRRAELLQRIAAGEARLAELEHDYDRNLSSARMQSVSSSPLPRGPTQVMPQTAKDVGTEVIPAGVQMFRRMFVLGFILSLVVAAAAIFR